MNGPAFNLHIGTSADLAALVKTAESLNSSKAATEAMNQLNAKLAQREFDRLSTAEKITRLKQQEAELVARANALYQIGNAGGSAQLNLAAVGKHEAVERLVAELKREQAEQQRQQALAGERAAAAAARQAAELKREQAEQQRQQALAGERAVEAAARQAAEMKRTAEAAAAVAASQRQAADSVQARLASAIYDKEFAALSTLEQQKRLREEITRHEASAARLDSVGGDAARARAAEERLAALQKTAQVETLVQRQQQQALAAQQSAASQLATVRARLGQLQRQEKEEAFAQLPAAEQLNQLLARRADLQRRLAQAGMGRSDHTTAAYQVAQAENEARIRAMQRQQAGAAPPSLGAQFKDGFSGMAGQFAAGFGIAAMGGQLIRTAREVFHFADRIQDLSDRMGVSAETAQEFEYAAQKTGTSLEVVGQSFKALTVAQGQAQAGSKEYNEAFKLLGISADDLKSKGTEQLFNQLAASIGKGPQGAQQLTAALKLLGRSSEQLLPAFRAGFADLAANAREAGAVIDEEVIRQLDAAADNSQLLGKQLKAALAPALAALSEWAGELFNKLRQVGVFLGTFFGALAGGRGLSGAYEDATEAVAKEMNRQERERDERPRPNADREREADRGARIAALRDQLKAAEEQAADAGLTKEEKRARLLEKQLELKRQIAAETDEEKKLQLQLQERNIAAKLGGLQEEKAAGKGGGDSPSFAVNVDKLQRMGGLLGGAATDPVSTGLDKVHGQLAELNRKTEMLNARFNRPLDVNFPEQ